MAVALIGPFATTVEIATLDSKLTPWSAHYITTQQSLQARAPGCTSVPSLHPMHTLNELFCCSWWQYVDSQLQASFSLRWPGSVSAYTGLSLLCKGFVRSLFSPGRQTLGMIPHVSSSVSAGGFTAGLCAQPSLCRTGLRHPCWSTSQVAAHQMKPGMFSPHSFNTWGNL